MKRIVCVILMICFCLSACKSTNTSSESTSNEDILVNVSETISSYQSSSSKLVSSDNAEWIGYNKM
ncbi:MAG: hypothetical protein ACOYJS_05980, partial [Acutalibacteraceae bacterium]